MKISIEKSERVTIITLEGNLLGDVKSEEINNIVMHAIKEDNPYFIINVEKLKYINSTGLSILISTLTKARKAGGELCLLKIPEQLGSLLKITKLDTIFANSDSIEGALKKINS